MRNSVKKASVADLVECLRVMQGSVSVAVSGVDVSAKATQHVHQIRLDTATTPPMSRQEDGEKEPLATGNVPGQTVLPA